MNVENGENKIRIRIDSYEFPYHDTNEYYDNNWLNVKAYCEDEVLIDEGIEPCLLTSELIELYYGLSKALKRIPYQSNFKEPNLKVEVLDEGDCMHIFMSFQRKNKDLFKVDKCMQMDELDTLVSSVKDMVDAFPVREKRILN